ncbi:terminase gpA endonuclease subunit [Shewanella glacialipiscicola]|uniref:terminase gpA endonuclease subunit n=1 Tax=Shewanella glacialipiscicola TaxID=614069 RepID=UPI003D7BC948
MVDAKPLRNAAEWATSNRRMPPGSPIPGPFNTASTPYMIPVCIAFADPRYNKITFVMGTQMGKSATMQNVIGWKLDDEPAPIIYVGPTESNINNVVEPKIVEMFQEAKSLWIKFDKKSSKHKKRIAGVSLRFAWAGSATELASDSAVITLVDELDRPDENATGEGDLAEIAEARGDAYTDSKLGLTSTPTHGKVTATPHPETGLIHWGVSDKGKVSSPIWLQWEKGTRHEWSVPCPDCDEYFIPRSELLWWPGIGTDDECTPAQAAKEAKLICPHCGTQIADSKRKGMNEKGVAIAPGQSAVGVNGHVIITQNGQDQIVPYHSLLGTADENNHFSLWVSGLCSFSAKKSYGFLARKLLEALKSGNPNSLLTVYNTGFGEIYAIAGEAPEWEEVYALRSTYSSGQVPVGFDQLICTVDVQKNRLYYVIRAWRPGMSSRLVEWGEVWGDTDKPEVWNELAEFLDQEWDGHKIQLMCVDAGFRTDEVLAFVRRFKGRVRALMGFERLPKPFRLVRLEVDKKGKTRLHGDKRWDFDTTLAKAWVHNRVRWPKGKEGDWLIPADITEEYCRHIVAEEFNEETGKWNQTAKRNDYLDCEGMQYMAARMLRIDRKKSVVSDDEPDGHEHDDTQPDDSEETPPKATRKPAKRKRSTTRKRSSSSGFISRYR